MLETPLPVLGAEPDLRAEIVRLNKIIQVLMDRAERSTNLQGSDFSLFQTAIMLEEQVRARSAELEVALRANEITTRALCKSEAELLLRASDLRFQDLLRHLPVPLGLYDAQGNIILVNDRLTATFGYTQDDIPHLSRFWLQAFPDPERRAQALGRWGAAMAESERLGRADIAADEYLLTGKDGSERVTEALGTRLGDVSIVVLNDVSARRRAETLLEEYRSHLEELVDERTRELRIRQDRLEVALEATSTGLWQWSPATGGEITTSELYLSQTYYTMLGYEPDEFAADHEVLSSLIHPDDRSAVYQAFYGIASATDDISFSYEFRMRNKQGAWRWILAHGKIVARNQQGGVSRVVGVDTDITERKAKEQRLQMAMQSLENTRESVSWIDEDGRILYVNPAMEQELGYCSAELLRMTIPDIDPQAPAELWGPDGDLMRVMKTSGLRKFETLHRHRDGHLIPVEVDSDGFEHEGVTCFIAISRDVSARWRLPAVSSKRAKTWYWTGSIFSTPSCI
jgi:PAS domain S-box-containing protein